MDFSWLDTVGEYVSKPFEWLGDNPEAAKVIGGVGLGVASGVLSYMDSEEQRKHDERMYERRKKDSLTVASSGDDDYDSHIGNLAGGTGLLTGGYLTKR